MDECHLYHSMSLPGVGDIEGDWDLRGRFAEYTGHVPLIGKKVLDVGTAGGFLAFEAEAAGANVVSFHADSADRWQYNPAFDSAKTRAAAQEWFERMRNGYWFAHNALNSKADAIYGDIYRLSKHVSSVDIVLVGQILVHLRNPLDALHEISLVAAEKIVISEGSFESDSPLASFIGSSEAGYNWWHLSTNLYETWLDQLGFELNSKSKGEYLCNDPSLKGMVTVWTFVFERR